MITLLSFSVPIVFVNYTYEAHKKEGNNEIEGAINHSLIHLSRPALPLSLHSRQNCPHRGFRRGSEVEHNLLPPFYASFAGGRVVCHEKKTYNSAVQNVYPRGGAAPASSSLA